MDAFKPRCDIVRLVSALRNHASWFESLRQEHGAQVIPVHKELIFKVSGAEVRAPLEPETKWGATGEIMIWESGQIKVIDGFQVLRDCISGLCGFLRELYRSVGPTGEYSRAELLFLTERTRLRLAGGPGSVHRRMQSA